MAKLLALFGPRRGIVWELDRPLTVGRSSEVGLQLVDEKVSREHCVLEAVEGGHQVRDLGSRNGTLVNGVPVAAASALRPGDHISVGESVLVYEPSMEALRARDGESTLVLSATSVEGARGAPAPAGSVLERAGELALRAATAPTAEQAAGLLAEAASQSLRASGVLVVRLVGGVQRPLCGRPGGTHLTVSRALLELAVRQGRALSMAEVQARADLDDQVTRVKLDRGHVVCAPCFSGGVAVGALCVGRSSAFSEQEIALAGALAAAVGPALVPTADGQGRAPQDFVHPVAESAPMREAMRVVTAAAGVGSTVLITGETGTGKEEIARALHAQGPRASGPFVAVNCGAIPPELAESELFGHEKGSFTGALVARTGVFEQADGGTLFLDEIGDLAPPLQVKLLRALQDRVITRVGARTSVPVDVRVVAATHRELEAAVKAGAFREDLYWRLNVVRVHLPPLRERKEDVLPLAERFLRRLTVELGKRCDGFTVEAREALARCPWPGNARQLANAVERALVLRRGEGPLGLAELPPEVLAPEPSTGVQASGEKTLGELVRALEREQIVLALKRAKGVKTAAAEALAISRPTLDRKIQEYEIDLFQ